MTPLEKSIKAKEQEITALGATNFIIASLALFLSLSLAVFVEILSIIGWIQFFPGNTPLIIGIFALLGAGKLVATGYLHFRWSEKNLLRFYLIIAVVIGMTITSLGVFSFFKDTQSSAKANIQNNNIEISFLEEEIQEYVEINNLIQQDIDQRQSIIDETLSVFLENEFATRGLDSVEQQRQGIIPLQNTLSENREKIRELRSNIRELEKNISESSSKLGPLVAVANGFTNTEYKNSLSGEELAAYEAQIFDRVSIIAILFIMLIFEPLAIALLLLGLHSFGSKAKKVEEKEEALLMLKKELGEELKKEELREKARLAREKLKQDRQDAALKKKKKTAEQINKEEEEKEKLKLRTSTPKFDEEGDNILDFDNVNL